MLRCFEIAEGDGTLGGIAFGGLTVGNLVIMMNPFFGEPEIEAAYDALLRDGWLEVANNVNGVIHARLRT